MKSHEDRVIFGVIDEFSKNKPSKSVRRKIQIIEAAIDLLSVRGVRGATHDAVAARCGVSRTLVRHYFPKRNDLALTAFKFVRARFQELCVREIAKYSGASEQFKAYVQTACDWKRHYPRDVKCWLFFYSECGINRSYRSLNTGLVEQGTIRIRALLEKIAEEKKMAVTGRELARAKLIQNAITGYFISTSTESFGADFQSTLLKVTLNQCLEIAGAQKKTKL